MLISVRGSFILRLLLGVVGATSASFAEPGNTESALERAHELRRKGDFAAAASEYRRVTEANPQNESAWIFLANALLELDKPEEAMQEIAMAPTELQARPHVLQARALVMERLSELDDAYRLLSQCIEVDPDNAFACGRRACLGVAIGKWDAAEADFELVFASPFREQLWLEHFVIWRWALYQLRGQKDAAKEFIEKYFLRDPYTPFDLYRALGRRICGKLDDERTLEMAAQERRFSSLSCDPDVLAMVILGIEAISSGRTSTGSFLLRSSQLPQRRSRTEQALGRIAIKTMCK